MKTRGALSITKCIVLLCLQYKKVIDVLNDYTVNIVFKNRSLESVNQRSYSLADYCQEQKLNLMHIITDVENAFYDMQGNKSKDDWSPEAMNMFQHIRHRLLDSANSIERLPRNLHYKGVNVGSMSGSEYIAGILNRASQK